MVGFLRVHAEEEVKAFAPQSVKPLHTARTIQSGVPASTAPAIQSFLSARGSSIHLPATGGSTHTTSQDPTVSRAVPASNAAIDTLSATDVSTAVLNCTSGTTSGTTATGPTDSVVNASGIDSRRECDHR